MSRRQKAIAKTEITQLFESVGKKIDPLVAALAELKAFKEEEFFELEDKIAEKKAETEVKLKEFEEQLERRKWSLVETYATKNNRVVLTEDSHDEMQNALTKAQGQIAALQKDADATIKSKVAAELKIARLEFDCKMATVKAENDTCIRQIENLQQSIDRLESELKDQKKLTGRFASGMHSKNDTD